MEDSQNSPITNCNQIFSLNTKENDFKGVIVLSHFFFNQTNFESLENLFHQIKIEIQSKIKL